MNGSTAPKPTPNPAAKAPTQEYYVPKPSAQPISKPDKSGTEAEIDALTSLLVSNMDSGVSSEPEGEFFGMCCKTCFLFWVNWPGLELQILRGARFKTSAQGHLHLHSK